MKKILSMLAALLVMSFFLTAIAEVVKPNEDFWYYDEAYVLSDSTKGEIFYANQRLSDACGAEIVVVAVNNTGKLSLEDYTYTLFNEWGIGGESYLGFLLVMDIGNDDYYAMTGTKLEGYIDGAAVQELLDTYLEPDFAKQRYDTGTRKFFEAVYAEVADQLNLDLTVEQGIADYRRHIAQQGKQTGTSRSDDWYLEDDSRDLYRGPSLGHILLIIVLILFLFGRPRRYHGGSGAWFFPSMLFHSLFHTPPRPHGPRPPFNVGHEPPRRPHGGFGGSHRFGSAGGSSRPSSPGRSSSGGGFGGASRQSSGGSRGPSTRGGGAGRGGRR